MKAGEFIKKTKKLGKTTGKTVRYEPAKGKGSHGRLYYGENWATIKDLKKEIGPGLQNKMLNQLKIDKEDF